MADIDLSFLDEDDEDQEQEKPQVDPKKLGYALRQEQKEKKAALKELEELRKFREEAIAKERTFTLKAAGLNDFHAEVYQKLYPEVSEENLAAYKVRAGLETPSEDETPASEETVRPPRFAPVSGGEALGSTITKAEFEKIMRQDPTKGWQLLNSGKVDFS